MRSRSELGGPACCRVVVLATAAGGAVVRPRRAAAACPGRLGHRRPRIPARRRSPVRSQSSRPTRTSQPSGRSRRCAGTSSERRPHRPGRRGSRGSSDCFGWLARSARVSSVWAASLPSLAVLIVYLVRIVRARGVPTSRGRVRRADARARSRHPARNASRDIGASGARAVGPAASTGPRWRSCIAALLSRLAHVHSCRSGIRRPRAIAWRSRRAHLAPGGRDYASRARWRLAARRVRP